MKLTTGAKRAAGDNTPSREVSPSSCPIIALGAADEGPRPSGAERPISNVEAANAH